MIPSALLSPLIAGPGDVLFNEIVKWIVGIAIVLGAPVIKSILESRERAKGGAKESDARRAAREKEIEGRRAFEELLRGGPSIAPPPALDLAPPPTRPAPAPPPVSRRAAARPLAKLEDLPEKPLTGSEFDAEEGAPESEVPARVERREREELERQREELRVPERVARAEYAASSSAREDVAPVPVEALCAPALAAVPAAPFSAAAQRVFGDGDRRTALRRAFVWNEVLGRPVAARDGGELSQPVGLRG